MKEERLQKFIARSGLCSRRKAEALILAGRVKVNGETITRLGTKIDPKIDTVEVDGRKLYPGEKEIYLAFHKPPGMLTTVSDPFGRVTIMDFLRDTRQIPGHTRIYHVGRLDKDSEGLLLLTNDGDLTHKLLHPSMKVEKEYVVTVNGTPPGRSIKALEHGIVLHGRKTQPCTIKPMETGLKHATYLVRLKEGRKRQIRHMFHHIGHEVIRLVRTRFGPIELGGLPPGKVRSLSPKEVNALKRTVYCRVRNPSSCK